MADVELRTTQCSQHGQPEISFSCDETLASIGGDILLRYFEKSAASGSVFKAGQTVQFGFMLLELRAHADGTLRVYEPDLKSFPLAYVDSVSRTLLISAKQKYVCESFSPPEEMILPRLQDSVILCNRMERQLAYFFSRSEPGDSDSGWFLGCMDESHDHSDAGQLRKCSLYEAAVKFPDLIQFSALPPERSVLFEEGAAIKVLTPESELKIDPGSFLDQFNQRRTA
jgi:hypothetical protein